MKCVVNLILLLLVHTITTTSEHGIYSEDNISVPYYYSTTRFDVAFAFGNPPQQIYLHVDLSTKSSWLHSSYFNVSQSHTVQTLSSYEVRIGYFHYTMNIIKDSLTLYKDNTHDERLLNNFYISFLDSSEAPEGASPALSLSRSYDIPQLSITEQLYNEHKITTKQFTFTSINTTHGYILFGNIHIPPLSYIYKTTSHLIPFTDTWSISATSITINGHTYIHPSTNTTNFTLTFTSYDADMQVPYDFLPFFKHHILDPLITNRICTSNPPFICTTALLPSTLPPIYITLPLPHPNRIYLTKQVLFSNSAPRCSLRMRSTSRSNTFTLGTSFLHAVPTLFNYHTQTITIIHSDKYAYAYLSLYYLINFTSVVLCCISLYLTYILYYKLNLTLCTPMCSQCVRN
jgi:hypothetical protein